MTVQTKTDNRRLDLKLQLRRMVLEYLDLRQVAVLDLCAGSGEVWRSMRQFVKVGEYVPVDISPRMPGTLHGDVMDPRFLSAFDLSRFSVVDIDTYGEPWQPWRHVFERLTRRTAVFLTHGAVSSPGGANISTFAREALGIPKAWEVPMKRELALFAAKYLLLGPSPGKTIEKGWKVALENVSYYGLVCNGLKS
jgi:hypothetical protein